MIATLARSQLCKVAIVILYILYCCIESLLLLDLIGVTSSLFIFHTEKTLDGLNFMEKCLLTAG